MMEDMLQVEEEIDALADIVRSEGVRSYLEIGSKFGGSLRRVAGVMPIRSRIVSVDLPNGTIAWKESKIALEGVIRDFKEEGYDTHLIWGNSQAPEVIEKVRRLGPFDAVFIDADHRMAGVTADWKNYGGMGRLIAFHDIAWRRAPEWEGVRIDVPEFWESIKGNYRHQEFKFCKTEKNNGIGVLWKH